MSQDNRRTSVTFDRDTELQECPPDANSTHPIGQPDLHEPKTPTTPSRWSVKDSQYNQGYNESAVITEGSAAGQFFASVKKNMVLKSRERCNLILEISIPIVFVLMIVQIWIAIPNESFDGKNFLDDNMPSYTTGFNDSNVCLNTSAAIGAGSRFASCNFDVVPELAEGYWCASRTGLAVCIELPAIGELYNFVDSGWENMRGIPDLDQMIILELAGSSPFIPTSEGRASYLTQRKGLGRFGKVHFVGDVNIISEFRSYANKTSVLFPYVAGIDFESENLANDYTSAAANEGETWGIVEFNTVTSEVFSASLHFNRSGVPWTNLIKDRFNGGGLGGERFKLYFSSGWLTWQRVVNEFYFNYTSRPTPTLPGFSPMPYVDYDDTTFLASAAQMIPLLIVLSFLYPVSQQTKRLVEEKEKRIREAMLIMGLGSGSFYMSHWLTYQCIYLVTSFVASVLLSLTVFNKSGFFIIFFLFYFFCLSCISLASLMSSLFSKSRLAALLSPLLFFMIAMPFFAVSNASATAKFFFSLLSPSAFAIGIDLISQYEMGTGMGSAQFANSEDDLNMAAVFFFLIFDTVWYFLLALWFDNVLPSEWGTQEHPCFCFMRCAAACRAPAEAEGCENDGKDKKGEYEPYPNGAPSVQLKGLRKEFSRGSEKFTAVNDLTLNMYEGQITVILGHNGAGKTTAINLMTGMLEPDAGDCLVYGKSVRSNMQGVRQEIGFCPQHNILWEDMTCREHLEYFAKLKGLAGEEMNTAVIEMIKAVDLMPKIDMPASSLSGGMKRKLSVAIAFVGKSRVVFLDEPTAGMDVAARRHTWDLIKRMSPGRTIVLTTHYMDEADLLGNSICIMSKGKLKCQGSSLFLKSRLGVGYLLNCHIEANADVGQITDVVTGNVLSAETLTSVSGEVSFRLPMSEVGSFPTMLAALETGMQSMGLKSFGISVTTMEEVFLKIGHDEEEEVVKTDADAAQDPEAAAITIAEHEDAAANADAWHTNASQESGFARQFTALFAKRFANAKRDTRTQIFQVWMPIACLLLSMLLSLIKIFPDLPALELVPAMYEEAVEVAVADCNSNFTNTIPSDIFSSPVAKIDLVPTTNGTDFSLYLQSTFKTHTIPERLTAIDCGATTGTPYVLHNSSAGRHAAPEVLQQYYRTHLKATYGPQVESTIWNIPMRLSGREEAFSDSISALWVAIFILIPFSFIPSTFVSFVVKERECKAKHAQLIAGMNPFTYWIANFCFDLCCFLFTNMLAILVFLIFNREEYIGGGAEFGGMFLLFLFYACAGITGAYFCSFAFETHGTAQNVVMLVNFIAGFLLVIAVLTFEMFEATKNVAKYLPFFARIVPSYCLGEGILNMASRDLLGLFQAKPGVFEMDVLGWNIVYMAIEFPLFLGLSMLIDHPNRQAATQKLGYKADELPPAIEDEDEDVLAERKEVESGAREDDLVLVKHLCKVYPGSKGDKTAVRNLSFGVKAGEVFGFLGTNGAGKTSTMSILAGEQLPTHGRGTVNKFDVVDQAADARRTVGYCPQFDATLELLNAEEHLYLYAGLRGIEKANVDKVVNSLIVKAGLAAHRKTLAGQMSGGNRRKLSVAIALIGAPAVVMLDEPSAGMDPMARRALWEVIQTVAQKCAVVLTTHHLEEVEALSNRVAIMVAGQLRCIGTLQNLKHKFGSGFEMSVRVESEARCNAFRQFMRQNFPSAREQEFRQQKFTFSLPEDTKLSETFRLVEQVKAPLGITDYSISQTSLEQVFLRIGAEAEEAEDAAAAANEGK